MTVIPFLGVCGVVGRTCAFDIKSIVAKEHRTYSTLTLASCSHHVNDDGRVLWNGLNRTVTHRRLNSTAPQQRINPLVKDGSVQVNGVNYAADEWTNLSPSVVSKLGANLHSKKDHPLFLIRKKIENFFLQNQKDYILHKDDSIHSVFDNLSPIVSTKQNFDSLLIPDEHVSRKNSESFYLNKSTMLRAHTSAHQSDLIRSGLDSFLIVGDVYRRDEIDRSHYPVFHQMEGVRLFADYQLFKDQRGRQIKDFRLFQANGVKTDGKQEAHSEEAAKLIEMHLKGTLTGLAHYLFGKSIEIRWVDAYFPFTHPSWEMEIFFGGEWMEVLGCGVIEQKIICDSGVHDRAGWAFGLGLERLAMILYKIPDIRLFWTTDTGFTHQFEGKSPEDVVEFVPFSKTPQCINDISFWLPDDKESYNSNDFYDLARTVDADELLEQIKLIDIFEHPKTKRTSHCYRLVYRHASRPLTQEEVNGVHEEIAGSVETRLGVEVRNKKTAKRK